MLVSYIPFDNIAYAYEYVFKSTIWIIKFWCENSQEAIHTYYRCVSSEVEPRLNSLGYIYAASYYIWLGTKYFYIFLTYLAAVLFALVVISLFIATELFLDLILLLPSLLDCTNIAISTSIKVVNFILFADEVAFAEILPMLWMFFMLMALVSYFFFLFTGTRGYLVLNLIGILPFWLSCTYLFDWFLINDNSVSVYLGDFNVIGFSDKVPFKLLMSKLTFGFGYLTLSIALFVLIYSLLYFRGEPTIERLSTLLMLFVNGMLILIYADTLVIAFIGWETIGVTSFFLINYWGSRAETLKAALKALVFNVFSDLILLAAFSLCYSLVHSVEISTVNAAFKETVSSELEIGQLKLSYPVTISVLLLIAASVKSAQFGLHLWLPDSMEAPAPASALIHSATLVSAGVFLLVRLSPIWENCSISFAITTVSMKSVIIALGAVTAAFGGVTSAKQTDLKKILAYSTISHCGYMMVLVGCGCVKSLLFYFYIHGLFKALLFLATGNIMRVYQTQDFRRMGGAWYTLPLETLICIVGFMHLSGAPFSLGYLAKHQALMLIPHQGVFGSIVIALLVLGACSSVFYSLEFIRCVFFEPKKYPKLAYMTYNEINGFSKYNNLSGKVGLLVLAMYLVFAVMLGNYLGLILVEFDSFTLISEGFDFTTNLVNSAGSAFVGYSGLSIAVITCYAVAIALLVYISRCDKVESSPVMLPRVIFIIYFILTYPVLYAIIVDPLNTFGINDLAYLLVSKNNVTIDPNQNLAWFTELNEATKLKLIPYMNEDELY